MTPGPAQGCSCGGSAEVRCWRSGSIPCSRIAHNAVCRPGDSGRSHRNLAAGQHMAAGPLAFPGRPPRTPCHIAVSRQPLQAGSFSLVRAQDLRAGRKLVGMVTGRVPKDSGGGKHK